MVLCLHFGVARTPPAGTRSQTDFFGLASIGIGLALIYAGLDQGNRLDWLNSGLIRGLLLSGALLVVAFFVHEARTPHPFINLKVALGGPVPRLLLLISFLRLTILSTAYLIPLYLQSVRGFRALEVGQTLVWIAAPQLVFCPLAALMLRRTDARVVAAIGLIFIAVACLMVAHGLTPVWGSDQFLPSQLLQAVGQSFALSGIVFLGVLNIRPEDALTFGALLQMARLMGGEIGSAFVVTLARIRGQVASNLIGLHVHAGDAAVTQRLQAYAAAIGPASADPGQAGARAAALLGASVRTAASTQSVIDAFVIVAACTAVALLVIISLGPAPLGPASHRPLIAPPKADSR
jgi:DHA2 family multidrug resistance protein